MSDDFAASSGSGLGRSAARGALTIMTGQGVRIIVQLSGVVIMARFLSATDYGILAMVTAIVGIGEVFRDFGLGNAAIQAKVLTPAQKDNLFWVNSGIGLLLCALVILCSSLIADFYGDKRLVLVAIILSTTFLFNGISTQFRSDLNRKMQFQRLTTAEVSSAIVSLTVAIIFAAQGGGYWALVLQQVLQPFLNLVFLIIATQWFPRFWHPKESIRQFVGFGANIAGTQLLAYASRNVPAVVLGATLGAGPVGLYNRAFQLMLLPLHQLNGPSTRVALPVLSRLDGDRERYDSFLLLGQTVMLHVVSMAFALLGAQAFAVIRISLGPNWIDTVPIFQILLIAGFFQTAGYASNWVYLSKGLTRANLNFSLISRPLMIVAVIIGAFWGLFGVTWAFAAASAIIWPFSLWWVGRFSDAPARALFFNGMRTIAAYGIATVISYFSTSFLGLDQLILRLVLGTVTLIAALALLTLIWPAFRRDVRTILGSRTLLRSARKAPQGRATEPKPETSSEEKS